MQLNLFPETQEAAQEPVQENAAMPQIESTINTEHLRWYRTAETGQEDHRKGWRVGMGWEDLGLERCTGWDGI